MLTYTARELTRLRLLSGEEIQDEDPAVAAEPRRRTKDTNSRCRQLNCERDSIEATGEAYGALLVQNSKRTPN